VPPPPKGGHRARTWNPRRIVLQARRKTHEQNRERRENVERREEKREKGSGK